MNINMDEEIITWNLRGPKRMKKRKELNALVKNNVRYKSLSKHNSSMDMFRLNSANGKLLGKSNESSSDNDDYYFSANKQIIQERKRKNCCKLIQMSVVGFVITFAMIVGITLIFSYSKFQEALKDLKDEFQTQKQQSALSIDEIKRKLNEYDMMLKKDKSKSSENDDIQQQTKLSRSIRSVDLTSQLNGFLIEHLFNQSSFKHFEKNQKTTNLAYLILKDSIQVNNSRELNFQIYNNLVKSFLKNKESRLFKEPSIDEAFRKEIFNDIGIQYIKPILESLETCHCTSSKLLNISMINRN